MDSRHRGGRCRRARRAWLSILSALLPLAAEAGEVAVKGEMLEGNVVGVTSSGIEFETIYGKGKILIPYEDIEFLRSDASFVVLYGDKHKARGRLLGISGGELLVGEDEETAERVPTASVFRALTVEAYDNSGIDALRSRYRFWRANFDLGFALTQATTDTTSFSTVLEIERKKSPTRLLASGVYRYGTQQEQDEPRSTIQNEARGLLRGEYDLSKRVFGFAAATAEYDEVQSLSIRTVPKAGVGVRIWESEESFLSADVGFSYVYQRFFGGETEGYPAVAVGGEAEYELPRGAKLSARGEYLPSVEDLTDNYLLRGSTALTVPMLSWLDFKLSAFDEYNNRPAEGADKNKFTVTAGLSLVF